MPHEVGESTARRAAESAGVSVVDLSDADALSGVERLLADVWGTPLASPPIPVDLLCGFAHAGGQVAAAHDLATGELAGAAVAIGAPGRRETYSLIAAARPLPRRSGVGYALKHHQREWSVRQGCRTMRWTFDPLVRRNAWFNLGRLGADVVAYLPEFFGPMHDAVNRGDMSDRLAVTWDLTSTPRAGAAGKDSVEAPAGEVAATAPDGEPGVLVADGVRWIRVPDDVVALRRSDLPQALAWRALTREWLEPAMAGPVQVRFTRAGWYRVEAVSA